MPAAGANGGNRGSGASGRGPAAGANGGNRSGRAALRLKETGYLSVVNIGGIIDWTGPVEAGEA